MAKKKKRKASKYKIRLFFAFILFSGIVAALGYNLFCNIVKINEGNIEKNEKISQIMDLGKENQLLEGRVRELDNPDYMAKYIREKYFYSKEDELILRIDD